MVVNNEVVSQGIVLLSIFTGFCFAIVADICLRMEFNESSHTNTGYLALGFFGLGFGSAVTLVVGVASLAVTSPVLRDTYRLVFGVGLLLCIVLFVLFIAAILGKIFPEVRKNLYAMFGGMFVFYVVIFLLRSLHLLP